MRTKFKFLIDRLSSITICARKLATLCKYLTAEESVSVEEGFQLIDGELVGRRLQSDPRYIGHLKYIGTNEQIISSKEQET